MGQMQSLQETTMIPFESVFEQCMCFVSGL